MRSLGHGSCCLVFACVALAPGCGPAVVAPPSDGGPPRDAFRERDSASEAGAIDDANVDANRDAAISLIDSGLDPSTCAFVMAEDLAELATDPRGHPSTIGLAAGADRFGIAYSAVGADAFENVYFTELPSSGSFFGAASQLTMDLATTTTPVVARTTSGWLLAWSANMTATPDIFTIGYDMTGRPIAGRQHLTTSLHTESSPLLAVSGATNILAWDDFDAAAGTHTTVLRTLSDDGMGTGTESRLAAAGLVPAPQALAPSDEGFVLGWSDPDGDAVIMPLDAHGAVMGPAAALSSGHDSDGTIDLAQSFGGGAAVFGARIEGFVGYDSGMAGVDGGGEVIGGRNEVHAHLVDGAGAPYDVEHVLTSGSDRGSDASIAEFAGGYAVSYRQVDASPVLRVLFLDSLLREVARVDLVPISLLGGRTTIRASGDGTLLIAWADVVGSETHIRAARIRCH
jgi:hypothetical protein